MVAKACLKFGRSIVDDDEADALWLLEYARTEIVPAAPST
jgi:hypothetical protein